MFLKTKMREKNLSVPNCTFIRESSGKECQSPAVKGTDRCYHHSRDQERMEYLQELRSRGGSKHVVEAMDLPPLETPEDIQICLSNLFHAVAARRIGDDDVHHLLAILRIASRNIRTSTKPKTKAELEQEKNSRHPEWVTAKGPVTSKYMWAYLDYFMNLENGREQKFYDEDKILFTRFGLAVDNEGRLTFLDDPDVKDEYKIDAERYKALVAKPYADLGWDYERLNKKEEPGQVEDEPEQQSQDEEAAENDAAEGESTDEMGNEKETCTL